VAAGETEKATRVHSGAVLQGAAEIFPGLLGGSADLAPSNKTWIDGASTLGPKIDCRGDQNADFGGRNIHFGVREHGMGAVMNGIAFSGLIPYGGTFLVFYDYMSPAVRMAAMMKLGVIYIFTHDSFHVGEDGPTHQPIEQLAKMRAVPGLTVIRPADGIETSAAWTVALQRACNKQGPTALVLSRQKVPNLPRDHASFKTDLMLRGGYVLKYATQPNPPVIIATGSEVALALEVAEELDARVISMSSVELFMDQPKGYRAEVIPPGSHVAVIEASKDLSWHRFTGKHDPIIGMDGFGASAPGSDLAKHFGFTKEAIMEKLQPWAKKAKDTERVCPRLR